MQLINGRLPLSKTWHLHKVPRLGVVMVSITQVFKSKTYCPEHREPLPSFCLILGTTLGQDFDSLKNV